MLWLNMPASIMAYDASLTIHSWRTWSFWVLACLSPVFHSISSPAELNIQECKPAHCDFLTTRISLCGSSSFRRQSSSREVGGTMSINIFQRFSSSCHRSVHKYDQNRLSVFCASQHKPPTVFNVTLQADYYYYWIRFSQQAKNQCQ